MRYSRRSLLKKAVGAAFLPTLAGFNAPLSAQAEPLITAKENIKITKLETFLVKPRWIFLKVHTDAGIIGLGEPLLEGRAKTVATTIEEIAPYLVGKDPRRVVHHWQAIYRHSFYKGGPILTERIFTK